MMSMALKMLLLQWVQGECCLLRLITMCHTPCCFTSNYIFLALQTAHRLCNEPNWTGGDLRWHISNMPYYVLAPGTLGLIPSHFYLILNKPYWNSLHFTSNCFIRNIQVCTHINAVVLLLSTRTCKHVTCVSLVQPIVALVKVMALSLFWIETRKTTVHYVLLKRKAMWSVQTFQEELRRDTWIHQSSKVHFAPCTSLGKQKWKAATQTAQRQLVME